jgi:hypothetical protein
VTEGQILRVGRLSKHWKVLLNEDDLSSFESVICLNVLYTGSRMVVVTIYMAQ